MYNFAPASIQESIVFGAARPGYSNDEVAAWISFMQEPSQGIQRVCCLLSETQLEPYEAAASISLLALYKEAFGEDSVLWSPIEDFQVMSPEQFIEQILPFLLEAEQSQERVLVHCAGGIGRTGQVLAAWLMAGKRGYSKDDAIAAVQQSGAHRNPSEAVLAAAMKGQDPKKLAAELDRLWGAALQHSV